MLQKMGLDPKSVNVEEIRADYDAMQARKINLEHIYKRAEKETQSLEQKLVNAKQYIGYDMENEQHIQRQPLTSGPGQDKHKKIRL